MQVFTSILTQTIFLFSLIAVGFILGKLRAVPENSATVLSKLENTVFLPALVLLTFVENFTIEKLSSTWQILLSSLVIALIAIAVSMVVTRLITKNEYIRKIYLYGLSFSNFSFMGNAIAMVIFPQFFMEYILFTVVFWILIYLWGAPALLIADSGHQTIKDRLKSFVNPMFVAMIIGIVMGLLNLKFPQPITLALDSAKACMSPVAMLLTGMTVASINFRKTFTDFRIYIVSFLRLVVYPVVFIIIAKLINMDTNGVIFMCGLCSLAMPLGLNTIVIPGAYGKDTSAAAGMALISHLLSCITIPIIFNLI